MLVTAGNDTNWPKHSKRKIRQPVDRCSMSDLPDPRTGNVNAGATFPINGDGTTVESSLSPAAKNPATATKTMKGIRNFGRANSRLALIASLSPC